MAGAEINRDGDLRLQYLAGWGINSSLEDFIYRQMLSYRQPPAALHRISRARPGAARGHGNRRRAVTEGWDESTASGGAGALGRDVARRSSPSYTLSM